MNFLIDRGENMKRTGWIWAFILVAFGLANGPTLDIVSAQTSGQTEEERRKQEIDQLKAETELTKERAALEGAMANRLKALIPQFEGTAKANTGVGELEASMLSTAALGDVARQIVGRVRATAEHCGSIEPADIAAQEECGRFQLSYASLSVAGEGGENDQAQFEAPQTRYRDRSQPSREPRYVILTGSEPFDFGILDVALWQMTNISEQFERLIGDEPIEYSQYSAASPAGPAEAAGFSAASIIPIASAVFGALRSEVEVTAVKTSGITDALLARAVASRLRGRAILPSAAILTARESADLQIPTLWNRLARQRARAAAVKASSVGDQHKDLRDNLTAVIARYDTFATAMATPDAQGSLPIARAARFERMMAPYGSFTRPYMLRLFIDQSGGSLVNTTNIGTFIGLDPLRVSGGIITSFTLTDPESGAVVSSGVFRCQTAMVRLRRVHDGRWRDSGAQQLCIDAMNPAPERRSARSR